VLSARTARSRADFAGKLISTVAKAAKYILVLAVALAAVSAAAGFVAARTYGNGAYVASAVAAVLNWVAGSIALATVAALRHTNARTQSVLLAMAVRMALPLAALVFFSRTQHPLVADGVGGLIVVHYLVGLAIETLMSVRLSAGETSRPTGVAALASGVDPLA
jgi:hypothetical protein